MSGIFNIGYYSYGNLEEKDISFGWGQEYWGFS